ncbi:hypothetical protein RO3G_06989 [Rhizopus delemar RA 99-880]|uniref:Uncharacterized protein n=1 Tax=Rhizopus delemar (strain RA 99-880 / ATCC MYA-4621 / FGSC 9543 / NRRL 43880) TaxID=246409 RepID=I1C1F4_RHIO9|nr:hypothetical protein RO3G_06989 [Rhizopus delemar RA 99-880]|eukprot:EIE82284.1 hypothetical protein RO3G_06989 [Rhizopus delemar RA 99-880]
MPCNTNILHKRLDDAILTTLESNIYCNMNG